jgi:hypothetical protein
MTEPEDETQDSFGLPKLIDETETKMAPFDPEVEYRLIEECPGYVVGSDGSVWSSFRRGPRPSRQPRRWKKLGGHQNAFGYIFVGVGKRSLYPVHQLVAKYFIGPRPRKHDIRHLDGNPGNNRLENLAYGTRSENYADSVRHGTNYFKARGSGSLTGEMSPSSKLTEREVQQVFRWSLDGVSGSEIARMLGRAPNTVRYILRGLTWPNSPGAKRTVALHRKLAQDQVRKIRELNAEGKTVCEISEICGCTQRVATNIIKGKTYKKW